MHEPLDTLPLRSDKHYYNLVRPKYVMKVFGIGEDMFKRVAKEYHIKPIKKNMGHTWCHMYSLDQFKEVLLQDFNKQIKKGTNGLWGVNVSKVTRYWYKTRRQAREGAIHHRIGDKGRVK